MHIIFSVFTVFSFVLQAAEFNVEKEPFENVHDWQEAFGDQQEYELNQALTHMLMLADTYSDEDNYKSAFDNYHNAIILANELFKELHFFIFLKASYAAYECGYFDHAAMYFFAMIEGIYSQQEYSDLSIMNLIKKKIPTPFLDGIWTTFDENNQDGFFDFHIEWIEMVMRDPMEF